MKVSKTINYNVTFTVEFFEEHEGGMGTGSYGTTCAELHDAIQQLELANIAEPRNEWVIVAHVEKAHG